MEAEPPVRHERGPADDGGELHREVLGRGAREKVKVKHATDGVVLQIASSSRVLVNVDAHGVDVAQKNGVRALAAAVVVVHGVRAVEVCAGRHERLARVPDGVRVSGGMAKEVGALAQTVDGGIVGERGAQVEVLRFEDEVVARRVK